MVGTGSSVGSGRDTAFEGTLREPLKTLSLSAPLPSPFRHPSPIHPITVYLKFAGLAIGCRIVDA